MKRRFIPKVKSYTSNSHSAQHDVSRNCCFSSNFSAASKKPEAFEEFQKRRRDQFGGDPPRKRKSFWVWLIPGCIVVLAVSIVGGWLIFHSERDDMGGPAGAGELPLPAWDQGDVDGVLSEQAGLVPTLHPAAVVSKAKSAIVLVDGETQGSGIIVDPSGYVVTNAHVTGYRLDSLGVSYVLPGKSEFVRVVADVVGVSPCDDLALLKLPEGDYPVLKLSVQNNLYLFQPVIALGYPDQRERQSSEPHPSRGEISVVSTEAYGQTHVIEHTALLTRGESGGALLDTYGNLIGVNVFVIPDTEIFYAVDVNYAREIWTLLYQGKPSVQAAIEFGQPESLQVAGKVHRQCRTFAGEAGDIVMIELQSDHHTTFPRLEVFGPNNRLLDYTVGSSEDWSAVITMTLVEDGVYQIAASSCHEQLDNYTLRLTSMGFNNDE